MTDPLKDKLQQMSGGMILDVASGQGDFLGYLTETFGRYELAIGIDHAENHIRKANGKFADRPVSFAIMDAHHLAFEDNSFDTVAINNSLHHLQAPEVVLREMKRVLRPGGLLIICEMYRDYQAEKQLTHVYLHHWWAEIDRLRGIAHNETYRRREIMDMVAAHGFLKLQPYDNKDVDDALEKTEWFGELIKVCDDYIDRIKDDPLHADLVRRGEELKERMRTVGIAWATQLCLLASK